MKLYFKKIDPRAQVPRFAHTGDMCFDLSVLIDEENNVPTMIDTDSNTGSEPKNVMIHTDGVGRKFITIPAQTGIIFHTGLKCATEAGWGLQVHVRSSIGIKKKLILSNATGIIDTATYRGELMIGLTNTSNLERKIYDGDRVAQGQIVQIYDVEIEEVDSLNITSRGEGGIGSSGR